MHRDTDKSFSAVVNIDINFILQMDFVFQERNSMNPKTAKLFGHGVS